MSYLDDLLMEESIWLIHTAYLSSVRGVHPDWYKNHPDDPHTNITLDDVRKHLRITFSRPIETIQDLEPVPEDFFLSQTIASETTIRRFIHDKLLNFPGLKFIPYKTANNRLIVIKDVQFIKEYLLQRRIEHERFQEQIYRRNPNLKEDLKRDKDDAHKFVLEWFEELRENAPEWYKENCVPIEKIRRMP